MNESVWEGESETQRVLDRGDENERENGIRKRTGGEE